MSSVNLIGENTVSTKAEILAHIEKVGSEIAKKEQAKKAKEKHEYDAAIERLENIHTVAKDIIEISNACLKAHIPFPSNANDGKVTLQFSTEGTEGAFITSQEIVCNNYQLNLYIDSKNIRLYNHGIPQAISTLLIEKFCDLFDIFAENFFHWAKNVEAD